MPRSSTDPRAQRRGRVSAFDAHRGLGVVHGDDGRDYPFHCTRIADDSREIDVGAPVEFAVVAGGGGRWEAAAIVKLA